MAGGGAKIRVGAYFIFENGEKNPRFLKKNMGIGVWTGARALYFRHHEVSTCLNSYRNYKKIVSNMKYSRSELIAILDTRKK